jgi:hypothetical protein
MVSGKSDAAAALEATSAAEQTTKGHERPTADARQPPTKGPIANPISAL